MKTITGHIRYCGPTVAGIGLHYGMTFIDQGENSSIYERWYPIIEQCPAIGQLFVPVWAWAVVRRELNFDYARNMKGTTGKYVSFYREVQKWLTEKAKQQKTPTTGVKLETHA